MAFEGEFGVTDSLSQKRSQKLNSNAKSPSQRLGVKDRQEHSPTEGQGTTDVTCGSVGQRTHTPEKT